MKRLLIKLFEWIFTDPCEGCGKPTRFTDDGLCFYCRDEKRRAEMRRKLDAMTTETLSTET